MIASALNQLPLLFWGGAGMFAVAALFTAFVFFDNRTVTGINPWIKPIQLKSPASQSRQHAECTWFAFQLFSLFGSVPTGLPRLTYSVSASASLSS